MYYCIVLYQSSTRDMTRPGARVSYGSIKNGSWLLCQVLASVLTFVAVAHIPAEHMRRGRRNKCHDRSVFFTSRFRVAEEDEHVARSKHMTPESPYIKINVFGILDMFCTREGDKRRQAMHSPMSIVPRMVKNSHKKPLSQNRVIVLCSLAPKTQRRMRRKE